MNKLLTIATAELGVKEIKGARHNKTILNYAKEAGFEWVNDDETAWCSIFLNWCTQQAGLQSSKQANARSWLNTGVKTEVPLPGDVVVYWRSSPDSWKGHVGIFLGFSESGESIFTLGGNQGNAVSIEAYPKQQLLGFRRLVKLSKVEIPLPTLRLGDSGVRVRQLQTALTACGFRTGKIDGIFGSKTREAVMALQTPFNLDVDGIYGSQTAKTLNKLVSNLLIKRN